MSNLPLHGIIPPLPTPFTKSGELDTASLQKIIAELAPDVDGFLVLGSNGEAPALSETERSRTLEATREAIPKNKTMLVGTGGESTELVKERNVLAAKMGGDAVLVIAPHYYRGALGWESQEQHFRALADASPLPVYIYNIPQVTGLAHPANWFAKISNHPNIAGFKDSSGDVMGLTEIIRQAPKLNAMTGNAPTLLPALSVGAVGGILAVANVIPKQLGKLVQAFTNGDLTEAQKIQRAINPIAYAVTRDFNVPGLKAIMRAQGMAAGFPRAPLQDVSPENLAKMQTMLEVLG